MKKLELDSEDDIVDKMMTEEEVIDLVDEYDKAWCAYMKSYYRNNKDRINMKRRMNYAKETYGIPFNLYHKFSENKSLYKQIFKDIEKLDLNVIHAMYLAKMLEKL